MSRNDRTKKLYGTLTGFGFKVKKRSRSLLYIPEPFKVVVLVKSSGIVWYSKRDKEGTGGNLSSLLKYLTA